MRISSSALDQKLYTQASRFFSDSKNRGIITYGSDNAYPENFETLILSSQTAKACWRIMTNFIAGQRFTDETIGEIIVGVDNNYNKITLDRLRYMIASSLAMYNGVYVHTNKNILNEVANVQVVPFKNARLAVPDSFGYSGKVAVSNNWASRNKNAVKWFNNFSLNDEVTKSEIESAGGLENFGGQIYHYFADNHYSYPLSVFDTVEFEMNTEQLVQVYKNREIANGFNSKTIIYVPRANSDEEYQAIEEDIHSFMGEDGAKELIVECDYDANANLITNGYKFETLKSNIDPDMFSEQYQKSLTNNIRKAANGMPAVLIDYDNEGLGQVSGESLQQAYKFYNAMTSDYRDSLVDILSTVFKKTSITALEGKTFDIEPKIFE